MPKRTPDEILSNWEYRNQLIDAVEAIKARLVVVLGADNGALAAGFATLLPKARVFGIDLWESPEVKKTAERRVADIENATLLSRASVDTSGFSGVDLLYIRSRHRADEMKSILSAWWPKIQAGGIISGRCSGRCVIDELCQKNGLKPYITTSPQTSWAVIKPDC